MYFLSHRISIGLILLPSIFCSASPLAVIPERSVVKRSYAFECGNDTIPYGVGEYEGFSSLTELCKGYPFGLGFICHENGEKGVRAPLSIISRYVSQYAPEIIRNGCMKCGCFDGEPETPDVAEPNLVVPCNPDAEGAQAAPQANAQAPGTCQAPNEPAFWRTAGDPQAGAYPVNCAVDHGKPLIDDCDFARQIQEDRLLEIMGAAANTIRYAEFMTVGAPRMHPQISSGASTFPITTPFTDIYGSCAVSIIMSSQAGAPNTDAVSISQLLATVWSINAECVEKNPPNVGGWESLGMYGHGIDVHVYQIGSEIDRLIKIKSASPSGRPTGISSFTGSSGTSSQASSTGSTAASGDSDSTVDQQSPSKRIRVCSSPVKCTDAATNYICNWKVPNVAQTVLEMIYGSLSTFANHQLAICVAA